MIKPPLQTKFQLELDPCDEARIEEQTYQESKNDFKIVLKEAVFSKVEELYHRLYCVMSS